MTVVSSLISIVIPVYNVDGYLGQCLDSIDQQGFADLEIIAVDAGSTDGSGDRLDRRATGQAQQQQQQPITVIHTDRIGPGAARNLGIANATGEYLWFVDGDDVITPGSLEAIASKLASDRPDVLFFDHELLYPDGSAKPGSDHGLIGAAPATCFGFADQPWVIDLSMVCWNKVINREFLASTGLAFSARPPHEEIPLSALVLPEASRLSVLKRACYQYRQQRPGSLMASGDNKRHFTIFAAYETVLDQAQKKLANHDPVLSERVYGAYFRRAIRHFATLAEGGPPGARFIAPDLRREFFDQMHHEYVRYRPAGYRPGRSPIEVKFRLIERGAYRRYAALIPANRLRVRARDWLARRGVSGPRA